MNDDVIPDATTALKVGTAILEARYGEELFRKRLPYKAVLYNGEWLVIADRPATEKGGGTPELKLSMKDGRVTRISWSR
jgi:NTF2 fold immunity protein